MTPRRDDGRVRAAIGIGASAGGVDALTEIVRGLPPELDACVLIVLHLPAARGRRCSRGSSPATRGLPVAQAQDGEPLRGGSRAGRARPTGTWSWSTAACGSTTRAEGERRAPGHRPDAARARRRLRPAGDRRDPLGRARRRGARRPRRRQRRAARDRPGPRSRRSSTGMPEHALAAVGAAATVLHVDLIAAELVRRSRPRRWSRTSRHDRRARASPIRPSRRCSSSSSARAGSTSPATSARASSAASAAGWTRSAATTFGDYLDYLEVAPRRVRAALRRRC